MPTDDTLIAATVRAAVPLVVAALARRYGNLADSEDAVQEALAEAAVAWSRTGLPDDPRAWLLTVARRRYIDAVRSDAARRDREERDAALDLRDEGAASARDDSLALFALCCHPALEPTTQVALTLRTVGGLTTAQIASAFYATEAAMTRRLSRAKRTIDDAGRRFGSLDAAELAARADAVRSTLYLMFTQGHAPSDGELPVHAELTAEAIRLTRMLHDALPADTQTTALLALLLLTDARTPARTDADGLPVPLALQDRGLWRDDQLVEGRALAAAALADGVATPMHVQAALAAVHAAASTAADTDWPQLVGLYDVLVRLQPGPASWLGRAAAIGMARGPLAGLAELAELERDERLAGGHRLPSVRAGLLERAGATAAARAAYALAASRASNSSERRWLATQAERLTDPSTDRPTPGEGAS
ncbi:sigma factor-like helix-turn-helix DNA-binding protein [Pseudolysinimonas kribbensis]|uniref:RNA polymerase sigma24 factor n=1 Tax=Pseudolysinimonas kribbensis TaxID=433641 RepID=A0ABQ6K3X5_9MICO|nr:sigma-70 family RNA polymerase sigma factor [Pseudolysinimonas kribbensis]GMA95306.1 RNA polymerase sigma24 factor [Pseudolysinimonas kribbensis]